MFGLASSTAARALFSPEPTEVFRWAMPVVAALVVGVAPAGLIRHEEVVLIRVGELLLDQVRLQPLGGVLGPQPFPVLLKLVVQPFQEQHPEDVFLVLRGIHVAPQDVARLEQLAFQPGQREAFGLLPGNRNG